MQNTRDRILIKKIQITNCGGFIGEHSLNLSESSDKNFTIILGQSGRGKSTLFGLTYWCLYGKHYDKKNIDTATDEGIINSLQMKNLSEGEKITASIVLTINDQDGEKYKLERSITATQHKESSQKKFDEINNSNINFGIQTEEFSKMVMPDKYGELKTEKNESVINEAIRQILPQNLSSFFLFDGEKLVKFRTKDESSELIKDGIEKISGLQVVDTLITHSENTHKGISKQIAGKSVSSQGLSNSLEALELKISENKSEQATLESNLRTESSSHDEISNRISKSSEGDRIQKLLDKEQKNKKKILKDIKDHDKKIHDFLFDALPEILISDTLLDSEKSFQILEAQNKIPPSITREAIDKIFQSSPLTCVCDREFEEHDAAWVALENIKKTIIDKDLTTGITQGRALISQIRDRSSPDLLKKKHSELIITSDTLSRAKTESVSELSDLELELSEIPSKGTENFDQLAQMKKESFRKTVELKGQLNRLVEELGDLELEQKELEKNLTIRLATEDKFKSEIAKINILKSIVKYVKGRRKLIVDSLRSKTESATSKYFLESVPQGGEFDHVTISSNYNIFS